MSAGGSSRAKTSGCGVVAGCGAGVGAVIAVRVNSRVSSVGSSRRVRSVSSSRLLVGLVLVGVDSVLDLVDETRHDECS